MDGEWGRVGTGGGSASVGAGVGAGLGTGDARDRGRDSMFLSATLTVGGPGFRADPRQVRVRNLSERGLMVELGDLVETGTPVTLELRGVGRVTGRIAWFAEGRAGVALDWSIDPASARRRITTRAR